MASLTIFLLPHGKLVKLNFSNQSIFLKTRMSIVSHTAIGELAVNGIHSVNYSKSHGMVKTDFRCLRCNKPCMFTSVSVKNPDGYKDKFHWRCTVKREIIFEGFCVSLKQILGLCLSVYLKERVEAGIWRTMSPGRRVLISTPF